MFNINQNRDIANNLINDFELNQLTDITPSKVLTTIQPVREVYEKTVSIVRSAVSAVTGTTTVYTTPSDKDFYLTYCHLSQDSNATCDNTVITLNVAIEGVSRIAAQIRKLGTTASNKDAIITFNPPIKLDRNAGISFTNTFTAGASFTGCVIGGYVKYNRNNTGS